jgi:hypothetical protein
MTPMNPQPNGIDPTELATDCIRTFSTAEKGSVKRDEKILKNPNPMSAEGIHIPLIHPVCRPKYVLEKATKTPITRPTSTPRTVKLCGCDACVARIL